MEAVFTVILILLFLGLTIWGAVQLTQLLKRRRKDLQRDEDYRRAEAAANAPKDPLAQDNHMVADPRTLQVGQSFEYAGRTSAVRGTVQFREGPDAWTEHFLDSGIVKEWLSVEQVDGDLEVVRWSTKALPQHEPGRGTIIVDDVTYTLKESGSAHYTTEGATGLLDSGVCDYFDYVGSGGRRLSLERYDGGRWEAGVGELVHLEMIRIYPVGWTV